MTFMKETLKASATALMLSFSSAALIVGHGLSEHSAAQAQTSSASQFVSQSWNNYSRTRQISQIINHVDFRSFSQITLGPDWRSATPEQKNRFQDAYRGFLIKEYSGHLRRYAGGEIIDISERTNRNGHKTVKAEIKKDGRNPISLEFSMYSNGNSWRIYNMRVEGISLSRHFRAEFGRIMDRKGGLDGLINHLERKSAFNFNSKPELPADQKDQSEFIFAQSHQRIRAGHDHFESSIGIG